MNSVAIVSAVRTPVGSFLGSLASQTAPQLGSCAIREALKRSSIPYESDETIQQVIMGNVLSAGVGQAPARQAMLGAGLSNRIGALTVNKVCGSGLMSVYLGSQWIRLGEAQTIVAGGMESMSQSPYLVRNARQGFKFGHQKMMDAMIVDGLWDVYNDFHMGNAADLCAKEKHISREEQDAFTIESYRRAQHSIKEGLFADELVKVEIKGCKGETVLVEEDEEPGRFKPDKIAKLKPVFGKEGTVTAANASSINDGAAAVVLTDLENAKKHGCNVLGTIQAFANAAQAPEWFTTAPIGAIQTLLKKTGLKLEDIDLFEINEAFSVVALAVCKELNLSLDKVNVKGGAVALGHPIGASGTRILVTLLHAMKQRKAKRGIAAICLGGGEAIAMLIESE